MMRHCSWAKKEKEVDYHHNVGNLFKNESLMMKKKASEKKSFKKLFLCFDLTHPYSSPTFSHLPPIHTGTCMHVHANTH